MIETLSDLVLRDGGYDMQAGGQTPVFTRSLADARPGNWLYDALTNGVPTYTGRSVNPNIAMTYTAVYACVDIISSLVASFPLVTYRNTGLNERTKSIADDYRYRMLREQPNREMSSFQWRQTVLAHLLLWGNSYSYLDWDEKGKLRAIWPLRPDWVVPMRNEAHRMVYRYQPMYYYSIPVEAGEYEDWQILHVPALGFDGTVGYSPITMARQAVALGLGAEEFAGRFLANNARPNTLLTYKGNLDNPQQVKDEWNKNYGGLEKAGSTGVLHGDWDVKTFSINPKDSQFLEGREWQLAEIARIYGVPLQLLADWMGKSATYASAEQFDIGFAKYRIRPWCTRIEEKINMTILGSQNALTCKHDMSDLLRGDSFTQMQVITGYIKGKVLTPNEGRIRIDENPVDDPEADKLWGQMQDLPIDKAGEEPAPAAATPTKINGSAAPNTSGLD